MKIKFISTVLLMLVLQTHQTVQAEEDVTEGAFLNIFLLTAGLPLITGVLAEFILSGNQIWIGIISAFIFHLVLVFQITILSHIYQQLTQGEALEENSV